MYSSMKKKKPLTMKELRAKFGVRNFTKSTQEMKDGSREGWLSYAERKRP